METKCDWANRLWKLIDQIPDNLLKKVEALGKVLKYTTQCYREVLQPVVNEIEEFCSFETELGHKYQKLSHDFYEICQDVKVFCNIVKLLREMADDQDRIDRLHAEIRCQEERGMTHFDSQNIKCFPELIDFLSELEKRVKDIKQLAEKIKDKKWNHFFVNIANAEATAARMENRAWWMKTTTGTLVFVSAAVATGGVAAIAFIGIKGAALGVAGIGGSYLSYKISGKSAQNEEKLRKSKNRFQRLRNAAHKITLDCSQVETLSYVIKDTISRPHPQPITTQLSQSLDNALGELRKIDCNLMKETKEKTDWITDSIKGN